MRFRTNQRWSWEPPGHSIPDLGGRQNFGCGRAIPRTIPPRTRVIQDSVTPTGRASTQLPFGLPSHASYAIDGYSNSSGFYQLGGMPNSSEFLYLNNPSPRNKEPLQYRHGIRVSGIPLKCRRREIMIPSANSWTVEYATKSHHQFSIRGK